MWDALTLAYPNIDPIALQLGPLVVRWYALAYVGGILLGYWYVGWLDARKPTPLLTKKDREDLIIWAVLGVLLGGRLGYILFYNLPFYLTHPGDILKVWHGGMAFHGGMLGVIAAFYLFAQQRKLPFLGVMDLAACATPIGLFFGRLANFVNGELFGRVTESPLGMVFPHGGDLPRHPSQLYEAGLEGALLFLALFVLARYTRALGYTGLLSGLFLAGYGAARFFVEFFREPDAQLGFLLGPLSMGQLLCVPMIIIGIWLVFKSTSLRGAKRRSNPD